MSGALDPPEMGAMPLHCDLCFGKIKGADVNFCTAEDKTVCEACLHRWHEEELEGLTVNKTIRLVKRGFYASGRIDPGPNPESHSDAQC